VTWLLALLALLAAAAWYLSERARRQTRPMTGGLHRDVTLAHIREWELYHNGFSLCSKKLRVCLDELGLDYTSHPIDLIETGSYENVGRRFLAVNPGGLVPVLVHQGHPVYESHEEIVYAARHAGERGRALLAEGPGDSALAALTAGWIDRASLVGDDPTQATAERAGNCVPGLTFPLFATMVRHVPWRRFVPGLLFHPQKRRPLFFLLLKLRGLNGLPALSPVMAILRRSRDDMARHLDALGAQLEASGGPWIAGERFTLADVSWVVILDRLAEADWDGFFWGEGRRPAVAAYWQRLRERPSYETAIVKARGATLLAGAAELKQAKRASPRLRMALEGAEA